jgi:hypothetical protein
MSNVLYCRFLRFPEHGAFKEGYMETSLKTSGMHDWTGYLGGYRKLSLVFGVHLNAEASSNVVANIIASLSAFF